MALCGVGQFSNLLCTRLPRELVCERCRVGGGNDSLTHCMEMNSCVASLSFYFHFLGQSELKVLDFHRV